MMVFHKCLIAAVSLLAISAAVCTQAQEQPAAGRELKVGVKAAPPFAMKTIGGDWTGISIELWRQIAMELNLSYTFRELDLRGLLEGVADGDLDLAVAALSVTSERENLCDWSHPYHVAGLGIATAPVHQNPWLVVLRNVFSFH